MSMIPLTVDLLSHVLFIRIQIVHGFKKKLNLVWFIQYWYHDPPPPPPHHHHHHPHHPHQTYYLRTELKSAQ